MKIRVVQVQVFYFSCYCGNQKHFYLIFSSITPTNITTIEYLGWPLNCCRWQGVQFDCEFACQTSREGRGPMEPAPNYHPIADKCDHSPLLERTEHGLSNNVIIWPNITRQAITFCQNPESNNINNSILKYFF